MTVALIDADIPVYIGAAVAEDDIDWGDGQEGATCNPSLAVDAAVDTVADWASEAGCKKVILAFSDRTRKPWRERLFPDYKKHRSGKKPKLHDMVADALKERFRYVIKPGLEGDDVLGILATNGTLKNAVIASKDKDIYTIPGRVWFPGKSMKPRLVKPWVADRNWFTQTLTGDSSDGFKGAFRIGPVKAKRVLMGTRVTLGMWNKVVKTFRGCGQTEADALQNARCARILRNTDYDESTGMIRLWHPREEIWIDPTRDWIERPKLPCGGSVQGAGEAG